jgi:hypothetical protein
MRGVVVHEADESGWEALTRSYGRALAGQAVEPPFATAGPGGSLQALRAGQFYSADAGRSGVVEPRPPADWLGAVPRAFRDPLPLRAEALRGQAFQPTVLPGPTHAQLAPWLEAELYVRRGFTRRFAALARDPDFRQGLRSRLRAHPEWGVVLDPPPPPATPSPPSPALAPNQPAAPLSAVTPRTSP